MKLRRVLILISTLAITANLTAAVYADQPSRQANNQGHFQYIGFRSEGFPVLNWQDQSNGDGDSADNQSAQANSDGGDQSWLNKFSSFLGRGIRKGFNYPVGSAALGPISCHGSCTTLTGTISLIPVWVGGWTSGDVTTWNSVLGNIVTSLGSSSANSVALAGHVFNTNTLYFTSQGLTPPSLQWVSNTSITDPTVVNVSDYGVSTEINSFISANPSIVPSGTTPVYIYIGAKTTQLTSGFGTSYCGWHSYGSGSLTNVPIVAFQDFTSIYNKTCAAQASTPNGNVGLDSMASVMVHELDETLTDPYLTAWYDASGAESADKCAWTWGVTQKVGTARYNVQLGSLKYLIQQDWLENNLVTPSGAGGGTACSLVG